MDADASPAARRRPRDSEATREAILAAAVEAFAERGYDGASTREIAGAAGIDTRLITRYFGSKETLFARCVERTYQKPLLMLPGHNQEVARALLQDAPLAQAQGLLLTIRSAANERASAIMREHLRSHYQAQLAAGLAGEEAVARAALLIAVCAGVQLMRNVLRNDALREDGSQAAVSRLAAALDVIALPEEPGRPSPGRS
jgi:AcrR family transcriptional regulator